MSETITFEGKKYKIENRTENTITLKLFNEFEEYDLEELSYEIECLKEELDNAEEEARSYQRRIDEFRYCGYNEEDPDFRGMCLHQNELDEEVTAIINKKDRIVEEVYRRLKDYDDDEVSKILEDYCIEI